MHTNRHFFLPVISLLALALPLHAGIPEKLVPEFSTSTMTTVGYDMAKVSTFSLSSMDLDWRNPGKGFSGQISYDVVMKQFMGLNVAYRFAPWLMLKIGNQKMSYLYELNYSPRTLEMCGYSQGTSYLGGYTKDLCGLSTRARDVGLSTSGNLFRKGDRYIVSYNVGVFNGNGFSFRDDDKNKLLSALIVVSPTQHLKVSAGGLTGKYTVSAEEDTHADRQRVSMGIWYDNGRLFAKAEHVAGKTGDLLSRGTFLMTGLWFREDMALALRGDHFLMDTSRLDTRSVKAEICFSHVVAKFFRYRIQYGHTFNAPGVDGVRTLTLSVSLKFSSKWLAQ